MKEKLLAYVKGEVNYVPVANPLMNNRDKDWYSEIGKYVVETLDLSKIPELAGLGEKLKAKRKIKITDPISLLSGISRGRMEYSMIGIIFVTSVLGEDELKKMFGEPIFHAHFGEGGIGRRGRGTFASYFVKAGRLEIHIGYDHRGTSIEYQAEKVLNFDDLDEIKKDAKKCFAMVKSLILLYKEKIEIGI